MHCESEWKVGSPWKIVSETGQTFDTGEIIESTPPKSLIIKWCNEWKPEFKAEGYSLCTFEIEPMGSDAAKLTITHVMDKKPSPFIEAVSSGWPIILSNLKSLLETGQIVLESKC